MITSSGAGTQGAIASSSLSFEKLAASTPLVGRTLAVGHFDAVVGSDGQPVERLPIPKSPNRIVDPLLDVQDLALDLAQWPTHPIGQELLDLHDAPLQRFVSHRASSARPSALCPLATEGKVDLSLESCRSPPLVRHGSPPCVNCHLPTPALARSPQSCAAPASPS